MSYSYGHSALIRNPSRVMVQNHCIMASSALLWYDFGLTLTTEVQRIWHRELSCVSVAYIFLEVLMWNVEDGTCNILTHLNDVAYIVNLLATAVIIVIRVYGISSKNWRWLPIVLPLNLVRPVLYALESARYQPVQGGPPFGCTYDYTLSETSLALCKPPSSLPLTRPHISTVTTISSATMLASHGILVLVTAVKTLSIKRHAWNSRMRTPLTALLLRDGILFLVILIFNAFANFYATPTCVSGHEFLNVDITFIMEQSTTIFLVWPYFYEIIYVIILSHFILDARGLHAVQVEDIGPYATISLPMFELPKIAPTATVTRERSNLTPEYVVETDDTRDVLPEDLVAVLESENGGS
ncbi:hypothetical protein K466DRAFT_600743 [Polyporus arcularius HHB13444]|uniref:DUF6533 domain-containing protein n=1 Tax=Polyporus arcularius HHB13444 TaxID=1314778 RepID=A0A5C3PAF5_9APHY|nr:hypothetical protein K466DRAFT_600743 [Polyporus arcularius HHB13444]